MSSRGFPHSAAVTGLLRTLAVLSPDGVRRRILATTEGRATVDSTVDILVEASVVTVSEHSDSVTMHRLIQRVIRDHSIAEGRYEDDIAQAALGNGS